MGRKNRLPSTYDLFIVGEQIRSQMTSVSLIKDHRHHFRKYRQCFVAKDAIDWLVRMHHVDSRQEAVDAMFILQEFNVINHVSEDKEFKDKNSLFRFSKDDDSYKVDRELQTFYRGLQIYDKIKQKGKDVMRNVYFKGDLHANVFYGNDLVDFLQEWEDNSDRDAVIEELKDLLTRDVIRHLTDDSHFVDDQIVYEFNINFYKSCLLHEVLDIMDSFNTFRVDSRSKKSPSTEAAKTAVDDTDDTEDEGIALDTSTHSEKTPFASKHQSSSSHQEDERILQLYSDNVGFGLILRGSSPCYIHRVAPLGPAAKAKVKVGHVVTSVNGQSVSHMNHKQVGLLIAQCESRTTALKLGVKLHRRNVA